MIKSFALLCALGAAVVCSAQSSSTTETTIKHFRLSFSISNQGSSQPSQSFTIDVPVAPGHPGSSAISFTSGLGSASPEVSSWQCSDVHESATGLAIKVAMTSDGEAPAIPGVVSARHRHGAFQRSVDLVLNKPTVITKEMHVIPLGNTDPKLAAAVVGPAPQITVTATEL